MQLKNVIFQACKGKMAWSFKSNIIFLEYRSVLPMSNFWESEKFGPQLAKPNTITSESSLNIRNGWKSHGDCELCNCVCVSEEAGFLISGVFVEIGREDKVWTAHRQSKDNLHGVEGCVGPGADQSYAIKVCIYLRANVLSSAFHYGNNKCSFVCVQTVLCVESATFTFCCNRLAAMFFKIVPKESDSCYKWLMLILWIIKMLYWAFIYQFLLLQGRERTAQGWGIGQTWLHCETVASPGGRNKGANSLNGRWSWEEGQWMIDYFLWHHVDHHSYIIAQMNILETYCTFRF